MLGEWIDAVALFMISGNAPRGRHRSKRLEEIKSMTQIAPQPENLAQLVFLIRGEKVLLDADLAMLYGVETGALNRAVKRNIERFPGDFMLQLTSEEWEDLRCQIGISSPPVAAVKGKKLGAIFSGYSAEISSF